MTSRFLLASALLWAAVVFAQEPQPLPVTLAGVQQRLNAIVSHTNYASAMWGIKVVSLDTGKTVFEHQAEKLFSPASNCKLYTVALGLDRLGPNYRIRTSLYAKGRPNAAGTLEGDLIIYGRGDPTFNARLHSNDVYQALQPLVTALTNAGVRRVAGNLVGDQSYFRGPEFGSGWTWDDQQYYYGAEISALTIADNTLTATCAPGAAIGDPCSITLSPAVGFMKLINRAFTAATNSLRTVTFYRVPSQNTVYVNGRMPAESKAFTEDVPVHDPARFFVSLFAEALERSGVKLDGELLTVNWLDRAGGPFRAEDYTELGRIESPPLSDIAREIQKPSQNLYTDMLLAHVGETKRAANTSAELTSEELGIRELNKFLREVGIPASQFYFEEGSGLSRNNLAAPAATVSLLQFMARHKTADIYLSALPVAGVDGTLRNRMKDTLAAGNVRAKTGSLRWAHSLSGYLKTAAGERLAFSVMLNRFKQAEGARPARTEIDGIVEMLAGLRDKSQ